MTVVHCLLVDGPVTHHLLNNTFPCRFSDKSYIKITSFLTLIVIPRDQIKEIYVKPFKHVSHVCKYMNINTSKGTFDFHLLKA